MIHSYNERSVYISYIFNVAYSPLFLGHACYFYVITIIKNNY